jgi:hypothetical protein
MGLFSGCRWFFGFPPFHQKSNRRSFDSLRFAPVAQDDRARDKVHGFPPYGTGIYRANAFPGFHPATPRTKTCPWGPRSWAIFASSLREKLRCIPRYSLHLELLPRKQRPGNRKLGLMEALEIPAVPMCRASHPDLKLSMKILWDCGAPERPCSLPDAIPRI